VKFEFFDLGIKSGDKNIAFEDLRTVVNQKVYVTDKKGTNIIYDLSLSDLEKFDDEMIKIITQYINSKNNCDGSLNMAYLDELRFRTSNKRSDLPNVTFRNPSADRMQMMMEYYEYYHEYNSSKIQLINAYMELMEHTISADRMKNVAQIITNIIHQKPIFHLEVCFY
jgi:hypothetical protein